MSRRSRLAAGNMWYARCAYIAALAPPRDFDARLRSAQPPPAPCEDRFLGIRRYAQEYWALSHPSVAVTDLLPYRTARGAPIAYRWALFDLPDPAAWEPDPRPFPRPGMADSADRFLLPYYLPDLGCSAAAYRDRQYAAVFGPGAAAAAAACGGFHAAWPAVALAAFNASRGPLPPSAAAFVADMERHAAAARPPAA